MSVQITIIGSGYVGLVSAACFAQLGHNVIAVDSDAKKIQNLQSGIMPIYEPGLAELVESGVRQKKLSFTNIIADAVGAADMVFLAVGTPSDAKTGRVDTSYVVQAVADIVPHLKPNTIIISKSTVPVGTGRAIQKQIQKLRPDLLFAVASNPEFLREGQAIADFMKPDRVVIGANDAVTSNKVAAIYMPLALKPEQILKVNLESSELIKYAANGFLATKIAFINEIADLAEACGADIGDVAHGIGMDVRIGKQFLNPGPGFGGSCFPKDTLGLAAIGTDHHTPLRIIQSVVDANKIRKTKMAEKIIAACGGNVRGKTLAILGLAFKAGTDDMREAPSLDILTALHNAGAQLIAFDPKAMDHAKTMLPFVKFANDIWQALQGADAVVILTEWQEFRDMDLAKVQQSLGNPLIVDLRNLWPTEKMQQTGLEYISIGRMAVKPDSGIKKVGNG